ncbi:hypothetical protein [Rhodopila sp.]|uniref:hypothetical protein n=1 Tax=Rhodopila sp. TaxID=2480087 RepID=UPI003D0CC62B
MTFSSRGVSVNFTTPVLVGARVRQSLDRELEILLPNPSGARGVYVLTWPAVRTRCHVTLHDAVLFKRFQGLATIEPASIRDATLLVAREGLAGRNAAQAAEVALAQDRAQRLLARLRLMTALVEPEDPDTAGCRRTPAEIEHRAGLALRQIAAAIGRSAAELSAALTALGDLFAPIGITATDRDARLPRLLAQLGQTAADPSDWLRSDPDPDISGLGETIRTAMLGAVQSGIAVLRTTRMALVDPARLLKRRISDPDSVLAASARCDWLLDGWERISLLWLAANTAASRRAALLEAAPLVPVLPREVLQWVGAAIPPEAMTQLCRVTSQRDAWRTGSAAFRLVERNEKLLAMSI